MNWEFEINSCKLLYIEWKNNKVLLYSTGNYIQYLLINYNGKEKNFWMCLGEGWAGAFPMVCYKSGPQGDSSPWLVRTDHFLQGPAIFFQAL